MKLEAIPQMSTTPMAASASLKTLMASKRNIIRRVGDIDRQLHKPLVCLTFDDGPDPVYTPMILDILREHKVSASFFVMGEAALYMSKIVGRIAAEGHVIGNHTYSHCHPWLGSADLVRQQVSRTTQVITQLAGRPPRWFRPPFGRLRQAMMEQAAAENMATVLWSHSIIDWGWWGTEAGIERRLNTIKAGDIVLMHDGKRQHNRPEILVRKLPSLLDRLKREVALVTLDEVEG